jgi:hypothetical protein
MNTRPYSRSVFGADTGIGHIDPPSLHLDMGPYAGSPINPHAFASGHQYGAAPGLRGQFVMQSRRTGRLGATMPPAYNTGAEPVPQLTQSFVYDPSGKPAVAVTPTVPVIPAQTSVMTAQNAATGQQTLTVSVGVPAPTHVSMGLVLAGLAAGVLIVVSVRHMVH